MGQRSLSRSEAEFGVMRTLEQALDPLGILNPGKIFDGGALSPATSSG